jgi:hypothetical protein
MKNLAGFIKRPVRAGAHVQGSSRLDEAALREGFKMSSGGFTSRQWCAVYCGS